MEECESLDTQMDELLEFQSEASDAVSQDDEDEVQELQNSLREVVQDQSVKPKLQCLVVDPSFSMVTVQSEDSGIVWETASSRCSTPWASETSSTSEAYSMDGPGAAGKITIIFDEDKVIRRRTRSGGRSSRLGDRLSRPGSSRSASVLGVERPEMAEVSLPNVKVEKSKMEPDLEEIRNKDQQLFSLISEGYEILNIRVPSKLPTVDEEDSTELQDNLSYLDQTPQIKSRHFDWTQQGDVQLEETQDTPESLKQEAEEEPAHTPTPNKSTTDIDYFEKFTLLDEVVPGEQGPEQQEQPEQPGEKPPEEQQKLPKETITDSPSASEESFVFVTDVDIVGEHLDEVFYGDGPPADSLHHLEIEEEARMRTRRESQRSTKESGSKLFGSQETILTPIYISPGPPKIIDPILLEEPTAMSFLYSDLYEDAVGERKRSDEERSEAESVVSERSYRRRFSDPEEAPDGYLEKFTLKDEIPSLDIQPEPEEEKKEGRMMWPQSKFEMTGCLIRVVEEDEKEKTKVEEPKMEDQSEDLPSAAKEEKRGTATEMEQERDEKQAAVVQEEEKTCEEKHVLEVTTEEPVVTPGSYEVAPVITTCEEPKETTERRSSDTRKLLAAEEEVVEEEAKEPERVEREMLTEAPNGVEAPPETSPPHAEEEAAEVVPDDAAAPVEVTTDCDCAVKTIVEVTKKAVNETEIQTQVQIDLQDGEKDVVPTETPERKQEGETAIDKMTAENLPEIRSGDVKTEILSEKIKPVKPKEVDTESEKKLNEVLQTDKQESEIKERESDQTKLVSEEKFRKTTEETGSSVQDLINVGDELIVFVPKGEAVEMDIQISQCSEEATEDIITEPKSQSELQPPVEDTNLEPPIEEKPEVGVMEELPQNEAESECGPPQHVEDPNKAGKELKPESEGEEAAISSLESSTPQEDLSGSHREEIKSEDVKVEEKIEAATEEKPEKDSDSECRPPEAVKEPDATEKEMEHKVEEDQNITSPLESFTPEEVLSGVNKEDIQSEIVEGEQKMVKPEIESEPQETVLEERPPNEAESESRAPEPVNKSHIAEQEMEQETEGDKLVVSPLRSFTPLEDLSRLHKKEIQQEEEEKSEKQTTEAVTEEGPQKDLESESRTPEPVKEPDTTEQKKEPDLEEDQIIVSSLRSFTPLEDLSTLQKEEIEPGNEEIDQKLQTHQIEGVPVVALMDEIQQNDLEPDLEEDEVVVSRIRSFAPLEDLSGVHGEEKLSEDAAVEQKLEMHKLEDEPETAISNEDAAPDLDLYREATEQKTEQDEAAEVLVDELEYEVINKQDVPEMPEHKALKDAEEQKREPVWKPDEEVEAEKEKKEQEEKAELSPEDELIEADYEIIDAEEENQARLAAELQGMDWFCVTCGVLLSEEDHKSGEHRDHGVDSVDKAYEDIKDTLSGWISELQGRSENIEDLVSELELAYNSVEDQCVESEAAMQAQNEEMMALVMDQYNSMSMNMEEEKKAKLEQLYDQIVSFQESIDSATTTLETTSREAETEARSPEDIEESLKVALDSALSLELGPKGLLVFEDYVKANTSSSNLTQRKGIPVPQRPTLQPQEPGSSTSTSVTAYWKVNPGDIIDCFQVYCMEDPQGAVAEEYRVTVKESYCVLEELDPDHTYKVWVMAVNYTGCSLPSERLVFNTAPSVPAIDTERCTILWDSATLRWSSPTQSAGQSYTVEYCRQYELEGEGLRSISGIRVCEQKVLLQPNENYLFYIKAVNEAGVSEQSEAALISTKGTRFHLLAASAHPALELSEDRTTVHYTQDAHRVAAASDRQCPSILGDLLPARGLYYWETVVSGCAAYRLGVCYSSANRNVSLGEDSLTWCLQCIPSPSGCRFQLLHNDVQSSVLVTETPERVGTLLDYQLGRLSFFNAQGGQLLGTFSASFVRACHPALALELPGTLGVSTVPEVPEFTKDS